MDLEPARQPIGARRWARLLGYGALAAACALLPAAVSWAGKLDLTPTLAVSEEYSTNIDLDPDDTKESGWITRLTPGGRLRAHGQRGTIAFDGGLTFRQQTAGQDEGWNTDVNLSALLDAELVPDFFVLDGAASVSQQTLNTQESSSSANQETVQIYRLSPALRSRAGSLAALELRYVFAQVIASGGDVSNETGHTGLLTLSGGENFQRLRWTLGGRTSRQLRSDDGDITTNDAEFATEYALTRAVHSIAAVGYQTFDDEETLDFDSPTWRAGLHLVPNRRLDLLADYGLRDDRYSPALRLRYEVGPRTQVFASYEETLGSAQQRLAGNLGFIAIDPETGEFIDDRAGTAFDPRSDPFDINDQTSRLRLFTGALSHDWRRTTATVRSSWGKEEDVDSGDEEDILSFDLRLQRNLSRRTTLESSFGYIATDFADGQDDKEYFLQGGLRHRLSQALSAFASYGYRWQDSTDPLSEFEEHRVGVGLFMEF